MKYRAKFRRLEDVTHEGETIKEAGETWWETLDRDTDDPEEDARKLVERFNNTLRDGESPRELLEVEVLDEHSDKHHWERLLARGPDGGEQGKCKNCGIKAELTPNFLAGGYDSKPLPPWDEFRFRSCATVRKTKRAEEVACPYCERPEGEPCIIKGRTGGAVKEREWPHKARVEKVEL